MLQLNQFTQDELEQALLNFMRSELSFTSLDVANLAKQSGFQIRNRDVSEWLRSNAIRIAHANGFLYNQTLISVDSKAVGITLAYLYHFHLNDADDYLDRDQNPSSWNKPGITIPGINDVPVVDISSKPMSVVATKFFASREQARTFVRNNTAYKFQDNGILSVTGERWSAIGR